MFPVSGAEQLSASGAICGDRPVISARWAYSTLLSPDSVGQEQVPQASRARLDLQILDDRRNMIELSVCHQGLTLFAVDGLGGIDTRVHEVA